jgi:hypothetical protein
MNPELNNFIDQYSKVLPATLPTLVDNHPYAQASWIFNHSHAPWLEILGIDAPYKNMLAEAQALKSMFVSHRNEEGRHQGWSSLAIHGIGATKTNVAESYGLDSKTAKYDWTEIQDQCPVTVQFFKEQFPYRWYARVRFMLLEPGGFVMPHQDHHTSFLGGAVNISLNQPDGCKLVNTHGTLPFRDSGSMFYFNNHYPHCVYNNSNTDRFHIIVHGEADMLRLAPLLVNSYLKKSNQQPFSSATGT